MASVRTHRNTLVLVLTVILVMGVGVGVAASAASAGGGTVYVATGENFPDALGAGAAGGAAAGPVLLVQKNSIPSATLAEVNRLKPSLIVVVGGTGVVAQVVEDQLKALSFNPTVVRFAGANRYETAALLSQASFPRTGAASCPGAGFYPTESADPYDGRVPRFGTGLLPSLFTCAVSLPHGATVTKLSAAFDDTSSGFNGLCILERNDIVGDAAGSGIGGITFMALTPNTPGSGRQTVATSNIVSAKVDNARYGYFVRCPSLPDVRIFGATVEYEMSS